MRKLWTPTLLREQDIEESDYSMEGDESACEENDESGSEPDGSNSESENEGIVQDKSGDVDEQKISKSKERTCKPKCKLPRIKRECPVPYCDKTVVHIPRHLVKVHKWPKHQARAAVARFNLRKKYTFSSSECASSGNDEKNEKKRHKDYQKMRVCPLVGCSSVVKRLSAHLQNVHRFSPKSDKSVYKGLLRKALQQPKRPHSVQLIEKRAVQLGKNVVESGVPFEVENESTCGDDHGFNDSEQCDGSHKPHHVKQERSDEEEEGWEELNDGTLEETDTANCVFVDLTEDADDNSGIDCEESDPESILQLSKWLQSPDGGKKDVKTAKQHVSQIKNILSIIDEKKRLASLLDMSLLKNKFVAYAEEKYVPQTIKSYLMSLRHFYSYVLAEKPEEITTSNEVVTQLMEKVKRWSSSYKRSSLKRKWEKMEEDRIELVTPDKIQEFEKSQASRDAGHRDHPR